MMKQKQIMLIWVVSIALLVLKCDGKCAFEAIFTFGDSNSDTGGYYAAFPSLPSPYGMTFFNRPAGRASDGRLYIDFLAQALGLPFLSPYLQSIGSDYKHGVNFATASSTVLRPNSSIFESGVSPFFLAVQLNQMKQFKATVEDLQSSGQTNLPQPDIFGKSLYTIYIGQNDFTSKLATLGIEGVKQFLPQVVSQIAGTIKQLYALGGRTFLVLNLAPIGCYTAYLVKLPHESSDLDAFGCMMSYNKAVDEYNNMLKETISRTRQQLGDDATVVHVDTHSILLQLFQHPESHDLKYTNKTCCGGEGPYNFNTQVFCGYGKVINGQPVNYTVCSDPQNHIIWDGIHTTEAVNKILVKGILDGSYFDVDFSFQQLCDIQRID